jgi:hypothetical protein
MRDGINRLIPEGCAMPSAGRVLDHGIGLCTGDWSLQPDVDRYRWLCSGCGRAYPATVETAYRVAWERTLAGMLIALADEGQALRDSRA